MNVINRTLCQSNAGSHPHKHKHKDFAYRLNEIIRIE